MNMPNMRWLWGSQIKIFRSSHTYKSEVQSYSHRFETCQNEGDNENHECGWDSPPKKHVEQEEEKDEGRGGETKREEGKRGAMTGE